MANAQGALEWETRDMQRDNVPVTHNVKVCEDDIHTISVLQPVWPQLLLTVFAEILRV